MDLIHLCAAPEENNEPFGSFVNVGWWSAFVSTYYCIKLIFPENVTYAFCACHHRCYKITARSGLYRKADSSVKSKPGNHKVKPAHSGIQQNETANRLAREGARTRPIGLEPFLLQSLSGFKSKIRNWIEKRKQTKWKVCEKYGTSQLCLKGPTYRLLQFISKLDRKHCRMLAGLLPGISICSTSCTRRGEQRLPHAGDAVQKRKYRLVSSAETTE